MNERPKLGTIEDVADASDLSEVLRMDTAIKANPIFWKALGITLRPDDPAAINAAIAGYDIEWTQTTPEHIAAVAEGARRTGLGDGNRLMNMKLASLLWKNIPADAKDLHALDIGCGVGGTILALIDGMAPGSGRGPAKHCFSSIGLIDPANNVRDARKAVDAKGYDGALRGSVGLAEQWLPNNLSKIYNANVVVMGASLHHMNVEQVLSILAEKLPPGALVGIAEWCHPMLKSWAHFRQLIVNLEVLDPGITSRFDKTFPTSLSERQDVAEEPGPEFAALQSIVSFWLNHAHACIGDKVTPMFSPFEGHMPVDNWVNAFTTKGFEALEIWPINPSNMEKKNPDNNINTVFVFRKP